MLARRKKPSSRYHHGDLRAALIATAWDVVTKSGVDALSLRSVADALGVSHAAPAYHFKDKAELLAALRNEAWKRFADSLEKNSGEGLRAAGREYIRFARAHPRQLQLMFLGSGTATSPDAARAWAVLQRGVAFELGPERAADQQELEALSTAAWSMVHGFSMLPGPHTDAVRERVLDVVHAGITASP